MSSLHEILAALAVSLVAFGCAFRFNRFGLIWLVAGVGGIATTWIFAEQLSRVGNGLVLAAAIPFSTGSLFRSPLSFLTRTGLAFATVAVTTWSSWLDFLSPALCRGELLRLPTVLDSQGVCLQQSDYTCGPAAAVTVLRGLRVPAEEGELAILAKTSRHTGTSPEELASAITRRFASAGIHSAVGRPLHLAELEHSLPALSVVRWDSSLFHWVAVLEISDTAVRFADPASGLCELPRDEFEQLWEGETVRIWQTR